jgi:hypothetical protein
MLIHASQADMDSVQLKVFLDCFCGSSLQTLALLIQFLLIIQLYSYTLRWCPVTGID